MAYPIEALGDPVWLVYTNWEGVTASRNIKPLYLWYGTTEWHPEPQWLIAGIDMETGNRRDFALAGFNGPPPAK